MAEAERYFSTPSAQQESVERLLKDSWNWRGPGLQRVLEHIRSNPDVAQDQKTRTEAISFLKEMVRLSGNIETIKAVVEAFSFDPAKELTEIVTNIFQVRLLHGSGSIPHEVMEAFQIKIPDAFVEEMRNQQSGAVSELIADGLSAGRISGNSAKFFKRSRDLAAMFGVSSEELKSIAVRICAGVALAQSAAEEVSLSRCCGPIMEEFNLKAEEILDPNLLAEVKAEDDAWVDKQRKNATEINKRADEERERRFKERVDKEIAEIMALPFDARVVVIRNYMSTAEDAFRQLEKVVANFSQTLSMDAWRDRPEIDSDEAQFRRTVALEIAAKMALAMGRDEEEPKKDLVN